MGNKKSSFGLFGIIFAAIAGAIAGLFLAPKSGKELRKDARKLSKDAMKFAEQYRKKLEKKDPEDVAKIVFGDVSEASTKFAKRAYKDLSVELGILHEKYQKIDKKKYNSAVKSVVKSFKEDGALPEATLKKLASYLQKDAHKLVERPKTRSKAKKTAKKTKRTASKTAKKS